MIYRNGSEIPIYIFSSSGKKPVTLHKYFELNKAHAINWPSIKTIWYPTVYGTTNPYIYTTLSFFFHIILGYILDTLAVFAGKKPMLVMTYDLRYS